VNNMIIVFILGILLGISLLAFALGVLTDTLKVKTDRDFLWFSLIVLSICLILIVVFGFIGMTIVL
jgi:hypothetical protein